MRRYKPTPVPEYGPYRCWKDFRGIHFTYDSGWSKCSHTVDRWRARKFLRSIGLPATVDFNDVLRSFTYEEWKNLHDAVHPSR
jgi:hypothetical protein